MKEVPFFIQNIDWKSLKAQKGHLIQLASTSWLNTSHRNSLEEVYFLIDALQYFAVDEYSLSEEDVFGTKLNE